MRPINWLRFTWDLQALPQPAQTLPEHYQIATATRVDVKELRKVISSAFSLDPDWNPAMQEVMQTIDASLAHAAGDEDTVYLALRHGTRVIGTAVVLPNPEAEAHFAAGPCLLMEYRNRGFGTQLLLRSLQTLREAGLTRASAMAKENSIVAKFLYPKFNSTAAPYESTSAVAA